MSDHDRISILADDGMEGTRALAPCVPSAASGLQGEQTTACTRASVAGGDS